MCDVMDISQNDWKYPLLFLIVMLLRYVICF
nr:MAG TPA_asm: hypothetical protein [Caudoviricetes sp.]